MTHSELVEAVREAKNAWEAAAAAEQDEYEAAGYSSQAARARRFETWDLLVSLERAEERARPVPEAGRDPFAGTVWNEVDEFEGYDPAVERKHRVCRGYEA